MSMVEQIKTLSVSDDETSSDLHARILSIIDQYPEASAIGREEYTVLPKADYMLASQVDAVRCLMSMYLACVNQRGEVTKTAIRHHIKEEAPWLLPYLPEWFTEENNISILTTAGFVTLMQHLNEMSFKHQTLKADYLITRNASVKEKLARIRYGLDLEIKTPSGLSTVTVRLAGHGVKRVMSENDIEAYQVYLSRAEIKGNARKDFPRKAVLLTIKPGQDGNRIVIDTDSPWVRATVVGNSEAVY